MRALEIELAELHCPGAGAPLIREKLPGPRAEEFLAAQRALESSVFKYPRAIPLVRALQRQCFEEGLLVWSAGWPFREYRPDYASAGDHRGVGDEGPREPRREPARAFESGIIALLEDG